MQLNLRACISLHGSSSNAMVEFPQLRVKGPAVKKTMMLTALRWKFVKSEDGSGGQQRFLCL